VGESITRAPVKNQEERTYQMSAYQTPDGGNGVFLKYDQPGGDVPSPVIKESIRIMVAPNPNNGSFTVKVNGNQASKGELLIYDILGVIRYYVPSSDSRTFTIDLSSHPEGIYLVSYLSGNDMVSKRVVKQ